MAVQRYQLPLDPTMDGDIIGWLDKIPNKRKAEKVREAIRVYLAIQSGDSPLISPEPVLPNRPLQRKSKPLEL